jgi:diketogulonate reductase-like aldo/keto reductase
MIKRIIPVSSEALPVIGIGSWIQFDVSTDEEMKPLTTVLETLHEKGGRLIDSSPMYGRAEQIIGEVTSHMQAADDLFYATKVWTMGRREGIAQMAASMEKMQRKTLDLVQVHNLLDVKTHMETLRSYKSDGRIRYTGITHYTSQHHQELEKVMRREKPDFVQFNYSIAERNAEHSLLQAAADEGVAVIINEPLEKGELFSRIKNKTVPEWAQEYGIKNWTAFFLKYIISHPAVTCVIPGTSVPAHAADNAEAGQGYLPDEKTRQKMARHFESL